MTFWAIATFSLLQILDGNVNTYTAVRTELIPPILASKIRFVPYSPLPRTVCMRVEILGCPYNGEYQRLYVSVIVYPHSYFPFVLLRLLCLFSHLFQSLFFPFFSPLSSFQSYLIALSISSLTLRFHLILSSPFCSFLFFTSSLISCSFPLSFPITLASPHLSPRIYLSCCFPFSFFLTFPPFYFHSLL